MKHPILPRYINPEAKCPEWTSVNYMRHVGRFPIEDDLERVNCSVAVDDTRLDHTHCGLCLHNMPLALSCPCCDALMVRLKQTRTVTIS